jgi:hypothetical protein
MVTTGEGHREDTTDQIITHHYRICSLGVDYRHGVCDDQIRWLPVKFIFFILKMTDKEIIAKNKELITPAVVAAPTFNQPKKWVQTIELAESGMTFSFSLTDEEVALAKARADRKTQLQIASKKVEEKTISSTYELAESGLKIKFTSSKTKDLADILFAEKESVDSDS